MRRGTVLAAIVVAWIVSLVRGAGDAPEMFARRNLVAWCIVPFDKGKRSPLERAEMLARIGVRRFAYDWREEHLPRFEEELGEMKKHQIEVVGVWFPGEMNGQARVLLDGLKKHGVRTDLWVMTGARSVEEGVAAIRPIAKEALKIGCRVGLYNHGGWWREPENQIAIIDRLREEDIKNVGMVYNLHHGHEHLGRFGEVMGRIRPHLLCLNLNGMVEGGNKMGEKILPVGCGELDLKLMKVIWESGYRGPVGVLNHTDEDAEGRLLDNVEGVEWLVPQLRGAPPGSSRPGCRTYRGEAPDSKHQIPGKDQIPNLKSQTGRAGVDYWGVEDAAERERLPLYVTIPAAPAGELAEARGVEVGREWGRSHGGDGCERYSSLAQIDRGNVKSLKVAWTYRSGDGVGNVQCNPIVVDGVMYAPTVGEHVVAVDGGTGKEIWRVKAEGRPGFRGMTYVRGAVDRVLFVAGSYLWSVEAKTGKMVAGFGEGGKVKVEGGSVVAPAVWRDVIVVAGYEKDVYGYDAGTGKVKWVFHTVPREGEAYAETWDKADQGANCWGGMAVDQQRGIVYVTTGSPKPNFHGGRHRGDNLFSNCVIALDAASGVRLWHFQEIRHDIWDLDIPAPPVLVTVDREGRKVDAVAAVTKIGNTLVLDRVTGRPLFPFRMRRAPVSTVPGEVTAAYQPDVELPEPFTRWFESHAQVTDRTREARRFVMDRIEGATFGWFVPMSEGRPYVIKGFHGGAEWTGAAFDPGSGMLYVNSNEVPWLPKIYRSEVPAVDETKQAKTAGRIVYEKNCMACHGGSREGLAVNPSLLGLGERLEEAEVVRQMENGKGAMPAMKHIQGEERKALLEYLFERDRPAGVKPTKRPERPAYRDVGYPKLLDNEGYPGVKPPWGLLVAINLTTGKIAWRVPLGEYAELAKLGVAKTGTENFGGAIVTGGGLVFCGGTRDSKIRAFDKETGEELWAGELPFVSSAPPTTYEVGGKQYVVTAACGGGKLDAVKGDAYVAFALP